MWRDASPARYPADIFQSCPARGLHRGPLMHAPETKNVRKPGGLQTFFNWRSERPFRPSPAFSVRLKTQQYQGLRLRTLILPSHTIPARNMGQMMGQIRWLDRSTA